MVSISYSAKSCLVIQALSLLIHGSSVFGSRGGVESDQSWSHKESPANYNHPGGLAKVVFSGRRSVTSSPALLSQAERDKSPVNNIWQFVRGNGPIHTRFGGSLPPAYRSPSAGSGLNRCEWAIISCCPNLNTRRRHDCFESNHCSGAWFANPCTKQLQAAVFDTLMQVQANGVKG